MLNTINPINSSTIVKEMDVKLVHDIVYNSGTITLSVPAGYSRGILAIERNSTGSAISYSISASGVASSGTSSSDAIQTSGKTIANHYSFQSFIHDIELTGTAGTITITASGGSGERILNATFVYF